MGDAIHVDPVDWARSYRSQTGAALVVTNSHIKHWRRAGFDVDAALSEGSLAVPKQIPMTTGDRSSVYVWKAGA